ncbi:MAG: hypothetical protein JO360_03980 [Acidobacteria bacterium]|nr:hypothetical protein [Acidobacteriota bacterium]
MNLRTIGRVKVALLCLMLLGVACVAGFSRFATQAQTRDVLKEFAAYKSWTRVNETPRRANNFTIDGQDS